MNELSRDIPWCNSNLFTENVNKFPPEELLKFAGLHVAWSMDGTRILASGTDELDVARHLTEAGIDIQTVVFDRIPLEDTVL